MDAAVEDLLRRLEGETLQQLRATWRELRFGEPPKFRSADLLRQCIAWRIQSEAFGGISPELRARLRRRASAGPALRPGFRIVREWRGERHVVEANGHGYLYGGRSWPSLTAIAREITGGAISGPRFFGLRAP